MRIANSEPGTIVGGQRQVTDAQIQSSLQGFIANGTVPATTANTLYFIYLPPGVVSILGTTSRAPLSAATTTTSAASVTP